MPGAQQDRRSLPPPGVWRIGGVPFCEPCAPQQEAYFSVGEFTDDPRSSRDNEQLVGLLDRMRRTKPGRRRILTDESEAA